jgi:signal peptidase I
MGMSASPEFGPQRRLWREYRSLLAFLVLMLCFRSAWADWVQVPSGSMNPTLLEGDRLLVDKHVYGLRIPFTRIHVTAGAEPRRGDILTFDSPRDGTLLVKRLVAVPGDTIAMNGEQLIVNGQPTRYQPADPRDLRDLLASTQRLHPWALRESGLGPTHDILLLPHRLSSATLGPVTVPAGMYFVLGDNRDNSADSRYIGFVPRRNIMGRATRVLLSLDPDHYYLPRAARSLSALH